jgi:hypothetical protein
MKFALWICLVLMSLAAVQGNAQSDKSGMLVVVIEKGAPRRAIVDPVAGKLLASVPEGSVTGLSDSVGDVNCFLSTLRHPLFEIAPFRSS